MNRKLDLVVCTDIKALFQKELVEHCLQFLYMFHPVDLIMGLLPNILGYRDPDVDRAISDQLKAGITFSLASELEIILSEKLVEVIPSA